ncbi:hypothetical protein BGZ82_001569 [Podila clonocystis]|nr:hypothetical protein BGZ82_001569 [Podila clonocystis]
MTASASQPLTHSDSSQEEEHEGLLHGETSHERAHSSNYNSRTRSTSQDSTLASETHHDDHDDPSDDEQPLLPAYTPSNMRYPPSPPSSSLPSQPRDHIHLNLGTPTGERQPDFDVDERRCRICLESEDDEDSASGKLISPCLCKGSSRYIHLGCLEQWRALSPRKASAFSCDTCHYHYSFSRPFMANILGHRWFLHAVTTLMFVSLCYACSWCGREMNARGLWEWKAIGGGTSQPELGTIFGAFAGIYRIMAKYNRRALADMKE